MTANSRLTHIPDDSTVNEAAAFPIVSEEAFALGLTELSANGPNSNQLWRSAERQLLVRSPGMSLEHAIGLRDMTWMNGLGAGIVPLHRYLRRLADESLRFDGAFCRPEIVDQHAINVDARSRQAWRWMTFAMPQDLLLVGMWTPALRPTRVESMSPSVSQNLSDHGFAESHLHVGAAIDFSTLWVAVMNRIARPDTSKSTFESPGAIFDEGRMWPDWLLRAGLARYILSDFLRKQRSDPLSKLSLTGYLHSEDFAKLIPDLPSNLSLAKFALDELAHGSFVSPREPRDALRSLYAELTGILARPFSLSYRSILECDPISIYFPPEINTQVSSEMEFVFAGLEYLESRTRSNGTVSDSFFAKLFWQSIRIRCLFYRHITQRPLTSGLQWFIRFFSRLGGARVPIKAQAMVESAAEMCGLGIGLRSLEIRTSPRHDIEGNKLFVEQAQLGWMNALDTHKLNPKDREFGIVFHLAKDRGGGFRKGIPEANWRNSNADPGSDVNGTGYRYSKFFESKKSESRGLASLLLQFPQILRVVRGIDICTDELAIPTWVMAPHFRYLEAIGKTVSSYWQKHTGEFIPPLRKTVHAGEDFVHIIGGLRSVSDCLRFLQLRDGDRIGHGLVLGINASEWVLNAGRIPMTREQRLLDLTWEWECYTRNGVSFAPARMAFIVDEVQQLSKNIFEKRYQPEDISGLVKSLHSESTLREYGFPNNPAGAVGTDELIRRYLTDSGVFERGHESIWVIPSREADAVESLQQHVRQQIANLGIVIEINPTSNLLIGNLGDLENHPLWRLKSPKKESNTSNLRVCIGSDDPITFATNLPSEYMLIHDAIVQSGLGADLADEWIASVRATGMSSRFTLTQPRTPDWTPLMDKSIEDHVPEILFG